MEPDSTLKFLYNAPAILYKDTLIVGDTHFGMEKKLRSEGIFDLNFSDRLFEKLKQLILENKEINKVVFLGDVKEQIEFLDLKTEKLILKTVSDCNVDVIIVRGNHDGGIEKLANLSKRIFITTSEGILLDDKIALAHGHAYPSSEIMEKAEFLIMAHQHPMIRMVDSYGYSHSESIWLVSEIDEQNSGKKYNKINPNLKLILIPAFNPLLGAVMNDGVLSQVLSIFKLNDASVYRLDGTCLGKFDEVMKHGIKRKR